MFKIWETKQNSKLKNFKAKQLPHLHDTKVSKRIYVAT